MFLDAGGIGTVIHAEDYHGVGVYDRVSLMAEIWTPSVVFDRSPSEPIGNT